MPFVQYFSNVFNLHVTPDQVFATTNHKLLTGKRDRRLVLIFAIAGLIGFFPCKNQFIQMTAVATLANRLLLAVSSPRGSELLSGHCCYWRWNWFRQKHLQFYL